VKLAALISIALSSISLFILAIAGCGDSGVATVASVNTSSVESETSAATTSGASAPASAKRGIIDNPPYGYLYHGVFPFSGAEAGEGEITPESVSSYESAAGRKVAWVHFSNNWFQGRDFPRDTAGWITARGSVPFIRLMLRSSDEQDVAEPLYTMDNIIAGDFDTDLHAWFSDARDFGSALIVEFGTEVNGNWFSWNGDWNGGGDTDGYGDSSYPDGPERFRDAFRHIIDISRQEGANNITWVFHIDRGDVPEENWNTPDMYYPGDEYIDWIGLSVYGPVEPTDDEIYDFVDLMDMGYGKAESLSSDKPIVLCEFAATDGNPGFRQEQWAEDALTEMLSGRWPRLIGFSWWNEKWQNDDDPAHDSLLMLQDNPELVEVFRRLVGGSDKVLDSIQTR